MIDLLQLEWSRRQRPMVKVLVRQLGKPVPTQRLIDIFYAESTANPRHQWSNIEKIKSNMNVRFRKAGFVMENIRSGDRKNGATRLVEKR